MANIWKKSDSGKATVERQPSENRRGWSFGGRRRMVAIDTFPGNSYSPTLLAAVVKFGRHASLRGLVPERVCWFKSSPQHFVR